MKREKKKAGPPLVQLRDAENHPFWELGSFRPLGGGESQIYTAMREAVPLLDAAITKLVRLTGGFHVTCTDPAAERRLAAFLKNVDCGRGQQGIDSFLSGFLDSLLLYGRSVGEMVVSGGQLRAVIWGDVTQIQVDESKAPLEAVLCARREDGRLRPLPYPHLLLFATLNPEAANPYGVSLFRSMPFLTDILLKIYNTIGVNWQRAGNVRYSVVCKPSGDPLDRVKAQERSEQMAKQWSQAMQDSKNGSVRDFVAVGDVEIKVIGADGQILDSQTPVRQILEQLVSKTGLPPFLLGLSWSSTERMSAQQADLLTSEIWAIRRAVQPVLEKICRMFLNLEGCGCGWELVWDDISLQDLVEEAKAGLYRMQTKKLEQELGSKEEGHGD